MCCSGTVVCRFCVFMGLCVCVSNQCGGDGGSVSSVRTAVHTAGVQLPSKGPGRTMLEGPEDGGKRLYLSPRMAYWLSSCKCCIEAPPVSSLPRFLCFTTSKVFSISLSLRVSTCLAVESREGNCASLKISGGPWLGPRLVVDSRAPGGR